MCACNKENKNILCPRCGYHFYNNVCNSIENFEEQLEEEMDMELDLQNTIFYNEERSNAIVNTIIKDLMKALELGLTNKRVILFDDAYCTDIILHDDYINEDKGDGKYYLSSKLGDIEFIFKTGIKNLYQIM